MQEFNYDVFKKVFEGEGTKFNTEDKSNLADMVCHPGWNIYIAILDKYIADNLNLSLLGDEAIHLRARSKAQGMLETKTTINHFINNYLRAKSKDDSQKSK